MVAALKKLVPEDFKGRFAAWWDGREYAPDPDGDSVSDDGEPTYPDMAEESPSEAMPPRKPEPRPKPENNVTGNVSDVVKTPAVSRMAALETLWGEGRFSPGSAELYGRISEGMQAATSQDDFRFGVLNCDPALTTHFMGASGMTPVIAEWRTPCAEQFHKSLPDFEILRGDLDRPPFEPGSLKLLVSQDGFAFADHKSGLAVRSLRSLAPGGQWIIIDTVRGHATGSLSPAFATSWAEPQLCTSDDILEVCEAAGFELSSGEDDVTGDVLQACSYAFERFGRQLDEKLAAKLSGVNKQVFVRELAWEAEAWKWRRRALAGDLLRVKVWKFRKPEI